MTWFGFDGDLAAVALDDAKRDAEAQAGTPFALGGKEGLEQSPTGRITHTHTRVANGKVQIGRCAPGAHGQLATLGHGIDGVKDEVGQYFAQFRRAAG